jgi:hypothetical protein
VKPRFAVLLVLVAALLGGPAVSPEGAPVAVSPVAHAKPCSSGFKHAVLTWGHKCLRAGQFCKVRADREYHRYGFHCHTGGRLSRTVTANNSSGAGCQPGYLPCLPRTVDLNCSDIAPSKEPVRVTGDDPYRLDGDGDGIACEP